MRERTPASPSFGWTGVPVAALPRLQQIVLPTPWEVGPVQIYVILSDPLTLIDTGVKSPASRAALETAFEALGHGLEDGRARDSHAPPRRSPRPGPVPTRLRCSARGPGPRDRGAHD